jgi:hypothetical protein
MSKGMDTWLLYLNDFYFELIYIYIHVQSSIKEEQNIYTG